MLVTSESLRTRYASAPISELLSIVASPHAFTLESRMIAGQLLRERGVSMPEDVTEPPIRRESPPFYRAVRSLVAAFFGSVLLIAFIDFAIGIANRVLPHSSILLGILYFAFMGSTFGIPIVLCLGLPFRHVRDQTTMVQVVVVAICLLSAGLASFVGAIGATALASIAERH